MKKQTNTITARTTITYYWHCMTRYPQYVFGWLLAIPIAALCGRYLPPFILAHTMDMLMRHAYDPHNIIGSFGGVFSLFVGSTFMALLAWRAVDYCMWNLEQRVEQDIAETVFSCLQARSTDFHANHFGGSLVSQTNKLMTGYVRIQDVTIFQAYPMFSGMIIVCLMLFHRVPLFTIGLLCFIVLYLVVAFLLAKPVNKHLERFAHAESKQTGRLADAVTNASVIKGFARKRYEEQLFHTATENTRTHLRRFAHIQQWQINVLGIMHRMITAFAFIMAVVAVVKFGANIPTVFLIFTYSMTISDNLFDFSNQSLRTYNRAVSDAKEMLGILGEPIEVTDPAQPEHTRITDGEIEFAAVTFTHQDARDALFSDFSLHIQAGEKIGLVGHSGSGKTTFTRLLLRYSDIQSGEITIDGQNIAAITQDSLHEHIAYVPQEPLLFHRTIRENIGYGKLEATQDEIERVAQLAHADEFISQLPDGYDTLVGERGVKLSGGQRQRVAIARAMLKDAPILLLDEATSALDSESEVLIQDALWKLMEGRTAIVIAHRLSTIQKMDRIVVLDEGTIVEEGSHRELLAAGGTYAKLWAHQSGGFIDD
jgi:ATP-binding cassette subfamily B protein